MKQSISFRIRLTWEFESRNCYLTSLVAQRLKSLLAMWETWVQSPGPEDPLENEMATHSRILAWRIPWRGKQYKNFPLVSILFPTGIFLTHIHQPLKYNQMTLGHQQDESPHKGPASRECSEDSSLHTSPCDAKSSRPTKPYPHYRSVSKINVVVV